jgi:hypothetical protein
MNKKLILFFSFMIFGSINAMDEDCSSFYQDYGFSPSKLSRALKWANEAMENAKKIKTFDKKRDEFKCITIRLYAAAKRVTWSQIEINDLNINQGVHEIVSSPVSMIQQFQDSPVLIKGKALKAEGSLKENQSQEEIMCDQLYKKLSDFMKQEERLALQACNNGAPRPIYGNK